MSAILTLYLRGKECVVVWLYSVVIFCGYIPNPNGVSASEIVCKTLIETNSDIYQSYWHWTTIFSTLSIKPWIITYQHSICYCLYHHAPRRQLPWAEIDNYKDNERRATAMTNISFLCETEQPFHPLKALFQAKSAQMKSRYHNPVTDTD